MIIIQGKVMKSIALANYINHNIGKDKKVVMFDSVNVPVLQYQIKRDYEHYTLSHSFENLINDLKSDYQDLIEDADVVVFECNISLEQLGKLNESEFSQLIIVTVQTDDDCKVYDTSNR